MKLFHKLNGKWNEISGSSPSEGGGDSSSGNNKLTISVGNSNQKIIIPEGGNYPVTPELHIVTKDIPKQLATNAQYEIDSPFGNVACDCYILFNNGVNDKWSRLDVVYETKSLGCLANCPGDGKLYLTTGPSLVGDGLGMISPYVTNGNTFSDWAIIVDGPIVNSNAYSSEEQVTGVWVDGRPVYKTVFEVTTGSSIDTNNQMIDLTSYNIDDVISITGYYNSAASSAKILANFNTEKGASIATWINSSGYLTELHTTTAYNSAKGKIIVEYNKTTDSVE